MPQPHSTAEKQQAIDLLIIHAGDIELVSQMTGISERTLYRWRQKHLSPSPSPPPSPCPPVGAQHVAPASSPPAPIPTDPDLITALTEIQQEMLTNTRLLSKSIPEAIAEAPLNQRILALVQLIDRIVKLNAQLPTEVEIEVTDHVEKKYDEEETEDADSPADTPPNTTESAGIG